MYTVKSGTTGKYGNGNNSTRGINLLINLLLGTAYTYMHNSSIQRNYKDMIFMS